MLRLQGKYAANHSDFRHHAVPLVLRASRGQDVVKFLLRCPANCRAGRELRSDEVVRLLHEQLVPKVGLEPTHYL